MHQKWLQNYPIAEGKEDSNRILESLESLVPQSNTLGNDLRCF